MNFEKPGADSPKKTKEFQGKRFDIEEPTILTKEDIKEGDRIFIYTESGNRYMIRHSKSGGSAKVYNERESGFKEGFSFLVKEGQPIAEVGKRLNVWAVTEAETKRGFEINSTPIQHIEMVKGIDTAIEEEGEDNKEKVGFTGIADMLREQVEGKQ